MNSISEWKEFVATFGKLQEQVLKKNIISCIQFFNRLSYNVSRTFTAASNIIERKLNLIFSELVLRKQEPKFRAKPTLSVQPGKNPEKSQTKNEVLAGKKRTVKVPKSFKRPTKRSKRKFYVKQKEFEPHKTVRNTKSSLARKRKEEILSLQRSLQSLDKNSFKRKLDSLYSVNKKPQSKSQNFKSRVVRIRPRYKTLPKLKQSSYSEDSAEKFKKMLRFGVPLSAVLQSLNKEDLDPAALENIKKELEEFSLVVGSAETNKRKEQREGIKLDKYEMMRKVGIPEKAVQQAMKNDGIDLGSVSLRTVMADESAETKVAEDGDPLVMELKSKLEKGKSVNRLIDSKLFRKRIVKHRVNNTTPKWRI
eukprot:snap_masked-scaffold_56-processed-gene-1.31-mRNA-1 protein AED:1.00 eAED:1.00 QI:0/0/0/0/1/1/2/0/364